MRVWFRRFSVKWALIFLTVIAVALLPLGWVVRQRTIEWRLIRNIHQSSDLPLLVRRWDDRSKSFRDDLDNSLEFRRQNKNIVIVSYYGPAILQSACEPLGLTLFDRIVGFEFTEAPWPHIEAIQALPEIQLLQIRNGYQLPLEDDTELLAWDEKHPGLIFVLTPLGTDAILNCIRIEYKDWNFRLSEGIGWSHRVPLREYIDNRRPSRIDSTATTP